MVSIPGIPNDIDPRLRSVLVAMRAAINALQVGYDPLRVVSNLQALPVAGGNKVRWTKSNGEGYVLYFSKSASIGEANSLQVGDVGEYNHVIGEGGKQYYYWVRTIATGKAGIDPAGPVSAISLGLNVATVLPPPPPLQDAYAQNKNY